MATYYVATAANGGDDAHPGTIAEPWLTLAKAVSGIASGDTVYFRSGTWQDERLEISYKAYTALTTFARYPDDSVGSVIFDGTNLSPKEYEDGVVYILNTDYVKIDGIKTQNFQKFGIYLQSTENSKVLNNITETTGRSGIMINYGDTCDFQYNKVYYANLHSIGIGLDECISIAGSTNIDVSHNEVYAGNRNFTWTGGEGLNIKAGCSYVYVHHNMVNMARPDLQENDRYCMGVDGWTSETHHIYFYKNIVKNGSWGIQYNSEEGGTPNNKDTHHIYAWNNIIVHCGHGPMHGGGIGFTPYGNSPGICDYCYWWNNTIYDCYYGAKFDKDELGTGENYVQNNIFYGSEVADIYFGESDEGDVVLDHNLVGTDNPDFDDAPNGDFHIGVDSDAIDAGATFSFPVGDQDDYDGIARPQGNAFDIGVFEYESGVVTTKVQLKKMSIA